MQAEAERRKRASVLESEGERQAAINRAEGLKQSTILESEAAWLDVANRAKGEAESILARAEATAKGVERLSAALAAPGGQQAASLRIAEQWVAAFSQVAKQGTTVLLPSNVGEPAAAIAQALSLYQSIVKPQGTQGPTPPPPETGGGGQARAALEEELPFGGPAGGFTLRR
jgi:regulator of protease activity HflC (stomatin/prohibitin superfamily)